ncbi:hypothetical protein L2E82_25380 [Cichorium intybus]|uniref:Uncharacterized protein n=1 Tax=Cichorium intybus TaxID=13427 RepID=A0ACB9E317_CICIN|nr:hypothetical protein L2E82_25380 [Cichorium intybus]
MEKFDTLCSSPILQFSSSGPIPVTMAKLTDLEYVDISFNKLTGTLPKPLANLVHLVTFNVSHNQLQGELPAEAFFNTISPSSVAGNPTLCGAAVNKSCPAVLPKPIVLNPNSVVVLELRSERPPTPHPRLIPPPRFEFSSDTQSPAHESRRHSPIACPTVGHRWVEATTGKVSTFSFLLIAACSLSFSL